MPSPILGIPRIVITDMDEDPEVKKAERLSEMIDWSGKFDASSILSNLIHFLI